MILGYARHTWGKSDRLFDASPLQVEVWVHDGQKAGPPAFTTGRGRFAISSGPDNLSRFSAVERHVRMQISEATLADQAWFRYHFLEASILTALDSVFFTPIHAACVSRDGYGILLCGDSGAGKSSFAYACVTRAGWTFVSDDAVHAVDHDPTFVVGNPNRLLLRPSSSDLFPEVKTRPIDRTQNGKQAIVLDPWSEGLPCVVSSRVVGIVFLDRRSGDQGQWREFPREDALRYFARYVIWGNRKTQNWVFKALLDCGSG